MEAMRSPLARLLWPIALGALAAPGCDWAEDRLKTCKDQAVELRNEDPERRAASILVEDERESDATRLQTGQTRRVSVCVERGDSKRFRALHEGTVLGVANCVVSRAAWEYEATLVRVTWDARGLVCENW
jgi:hypothetical protein